MNWPAIRRYLGYGVGDFGLNIYWNGLTFVLLFWYAEVVGVAPAVAGAIYFVGTLWDAVSDVVIANLAERVRTRFGTYRPFILLGGAGLGVSFVLLFWAPPFDGGLLIATLAVVHIGFRTSYTIVAVPYSALAARLTYSSVDRNIYSGVRMFFAFSGLLAVSLLWFPLARQFGDGNETSPAGFQAVAALGAIAATFALLLCFAGTREQPPLGVSGGALHHTLMRIGEALKGNGALRWLLLTIFLQSAALASFVIPLAFFIEAQGDAVASKEGVMTAYAVATLVSIPVWTWLIRRVGRKRSWVGACIVVALAGLDLAIFGGRPLAGIPLQVMVYGAAFGAFGVLVWGWAPDTVEYGQAATSDRNEGAVFGLILVVQKFAGGVTGLAVGIMLSAAGYEAGLGQQARSTVDALGLFLFAVPSVLLGLSALSVLKMPHDRRRHAQIVRRLAEPS